MITTASASAEDGNSVPQKLVAGTLNLPPFVMKKSTGEWEGLSVDLLQAVARELGTEFELHEFTSIAEIKKAVSNGEIDLIPVSSLTESLELIFDFSNPYYRSGSAIAVKVEDEGHTLLRVAKHFLSVNFFQVIAFLLMIWLIAGTLVWMFEYKKNIEMFDDKIIKGLGHGIWWAAVTMTTVGYGDKAPKTLGGRMVAIVWMFASIVLISSFTATITTSLTVGELRGKVQGFYDLPNVRVGSITESPIIDYLAKYGITARPYETAEKGLRAVADDQIDAFVLDEAVMKHLVKSLFPALLRVLPGTFNHYYVGMALPQNAKLREPLNRAMLKIMKKEKWEQLVKHYLGSGS
jgi:ABC-type amino acid transport substrate-binding protein